MGLAHANFSVLKVFSADQQGDEISTELTGNAAGKYNATFVVVEHNSVDGQTFAFAFDVDGTFTAALTPPEFGFQQQPNVPPPQITPPPVTNPLVPPVLALATVEMPVLTPPQLAALNSLFNFDAGSSGGSMAALPSRRNIELVEEAIFYDSASMPEEHGQDVVLAMALLIVPEVEGSEFSDERPDPQKLPHLAALELPLPELIAPAETAEEAGPESTQSWWLAGSAGAVLAGSLAVLITPRVLRKKKKLAGGSSSARRWWSKS